MVRKDSLESAICLGIHDSDASCCQVIAPSALIFVMFQIVTKLKVEMRRDYSDRCWVREFRCPGSIIWKMIC